METRRRSTTRVYVVVLELLCLAVVGRWVLIVVILGQVVNVYMANAGSSVSTFKGTSGAAWFKVSDVQLRAVRLLD